MTTEAKLTDRASLAYRTLAKMEVALEPRTGERGKTGFLKDDILLEMRQPFLAKPVWWDIMEELEQNTNLVESFWSDEENNLLYRTV